MIVPSLRILVNIRRQSVSTQLLFGACRASNKAFANTLGLPFSVSPDDALDKFRTWASREQGLSQGLLGQNLGITAAYCPVWTFDVNVKFVDSDKKKAFVPTAFARAYPHQTILHLPGLSAYAGYTYRRTLIDPVHSTSMLFLGQEQLTPFHSYMLRDMQLRDGSKLTVFPDPWNASQGRALQVIKELLAGMADQSRKFELKTEVVSARRVYLPTYIVNYRVLGAEYQAIISGCDAAASVSGVSHTLFDVSSLTPSESFAMSAGAAAQQVVRLVGGRGLASILSILFQFFGSLATRLVVRIPLIAAIGGTFFSWRKLIRPWMDNRTASAEWERQRDNEALMPNSVTNDFTDVNNAAFRYFQSNRARILKSLSGDESHGRGNFDWYAAWEEWSRQQWEQQQRQNESNQRQHQHHQQQTRNSRRQRPRNEFKWDFDPNDPYSVLGIYRGASTKEISAAFRKQMLLHHPDTKANASESERARAEERSKLITNAYQKLKTSTKK